jgi:hypothetical protein
MELGNNNNIYKILIMIIIRKILLLKTKKTIVLPRKSGWAVAHLFWLLQEILGINRFLHLCNMDFLNGPSQIRSIPGGLLSKTTLKRNKNTTGSFPNFIFGNAPSPPLPTRTRPCHRESIY